LFFHTVRTCPFIRVCLCFALLLFLL